MNHSPEASTRPATSPPALRGDLCLSLSPGSLRTPLAILDRDPTISALLDASAGVRENYSVREHLEMALGQQRKYRLGSHLPRPTTGSPSLGEAGVVLTLALHDIDKHNGEDRSKSAQHQRTLAFIERHKHQLPLTDPQRSVVKDLIGNDLFGALFKKLFPYRPPPDEKLALGQKLRRKTLSHDEYLSTVAQWESAVVASLLPSSERSTLIRECAEEFKRSSNRVGLSPCELFETKLAFFQSDLSAYTGDAVAFKPNGHALPAIPSLDYAFARRGEEHPTMRFEVAPGEGRLRFSPRYEALFLELRETALHNSF